MDNELTRKKAEMAARRQRVWQLTLERKTQDEIGTLTGYSRATISRDVHYMIQAANKLLEKEVAAERVIQLEQLRLVVHEAFEAWIASKKRGTAITEVKRTVHDKNGVAHEDRTVTSHVIERSGDAIYLTTIMSALESIRRLFGLDKAAGDWEAELKSAGYDSGDIFELMVQQAYRERIEKEPDE